MSSKLPRARTNFKIIEGEYRISQISEQRRTGIYDDDVIEFARAVAKAQSEKGSTLVSSEIFEVMWNLEYRKMFEIEPGIFMEKKKC